LHTMQNSMCACSPTGQNTSPCVLAASAWNTGSQDPPHCPASTRMVSEESQEARSPSALKASHVSDAPSLSGSGPQSVLTCAGTSYTCAARGGALGCAWWGGGGGGTLRGHCSSVASLLSTLATCPAGALHLGCVPRCSELCTMAAAGCGAPSRRAGEREGAPSLLAALRPHRLAEGLCQQPI
jgi:hypothetical protein